ncbi:hypothetical protein HGRIS_003816 [Hohenbuehelia grisea]|uniref:Homeobox domain-containing protein n=1 Tax=Hohenbuehelia grisea TaxID=104357 RepID=A0ABR3JHH8_9AGAR
MPTAKKSVRKAAKKKKATVKAPEALLKIKEELAEAAIPPVPSNSSPRRGRNLQNPKSVRTRIPPENLEELAIIWESDQRFPSAKSRRAWSLARGLRTNLVNQWWYRRRDLAKRKNITIPDGEYELSVDAPLPACAVKVEEVLHKDTLMDVDPFSDDTAVPSSDGISYASSETAHTSSSPVPIDLEDSCDYDRKLMGRRAYMDIGMLLNPSTSLAADEDTDAQPAPIPSNPDLAPDLEEHLENMSTPAPNEPEEPAICGDNLACDIPLVSPQPELHTPIVDDENEIDFSRYPELFVPPAEGLAQEQFFMLMQLSAIPFLYRSPDLRCSCSASAANATLNFDFTLTSHHNRLACPCITRPRGGFACNGSLYTQDGFVIGPDPYFDVSMLIDTTDLDGAEVEDTDLTTCLVADSTYTKERLSPSCKP